MGVGLVGVGECGIQVEAGSILGRVCEGEFEEVCGCGVGFVD